MKTAPVNGHGHSNSDSGRSSSSKSTGSGSLSGRGQPLSDSGSSGRSPVPVEGYEGVVRDLEDKLRERQNHFKPENVMYEDRKSTRLNSSH